jgi:hypothetical protein
VEAVHRADFHAVGVFALDAVFDNDKGHGKPVYLKVRGPGRNLVEA